MTDEQKRETTAACCDALGLDITKAGHMCLGDTLGAIRRFDPFKSLDDARLLLEECQRRGLLHEVAQTLWMAHGTGTDEIIFGLLATPEQKTMAVFEVIEQQATKHDPHHNDPADHGRNDCHPDPGQTVWR